jgi:hypothetical protein
VRVFVTAIAGDVREHDVVRVTGKRNEVVSAIITATDTALHAAPALQAGAMHVVVSPKTVAAPGTSRDTGPTVREYGEHWLTTRGDIETYADECGRLRNHVFPRIGDMRMRDVRPRHIRDLVLDLKKSNVHLRGTAKGLGTTKIARVRSAISTVWSGGCSARP